MKIAKSWKDYELIDLDNGMKLERWGKHIFLRPDPQVIWNDSKDFKYDAKYSRSSTGGGSWNKEDIEPFKIEYNKLVFNVKLMSFKHTGVFPEQSINWDYMIDKIKKINREIKVLNLFAYTGGATLACLYAGASVVHLDSSKGMVEWAKENVKASKLDDKPVRFIVDDVIKFTEREVRRGNKYDAIIMDPPSYGRGINGEVWDIEKDLYNLLNICSKLLSDNPLFVLINSYTTGLSPKVLENLLIKTIPYKGIISSDEIGLESNDGLILPCGIYGRWESNE